MSLVDLLPLLLIGVVFYFLIIRPQQQERTEHEKFLNSLAKDDAIVTRSGMHARVVSVEGEFVMLDLGDKVHAKFDKSAVARKQGDPPKPT